MIALLANCHGSQRASASETDFVTVSSAAAPPVELALTRGKTALTVTVAVGAAEDERVQVRLGIAADRHLVSDRVGEDMGRVRRVFAVPNRALVNTTDGWRRLRLGLTVAWSDAHGMVRRRERFRQVDGRAPHVPLSLNPDDWEAFDLPAYEEAIADRRQAVRIPVAQPMDGKLSLVIEDAEGSRIRNLVSGRPFPKGKHEIVWDCLDEDANLVAPVQYRWRAISHPGITPHYLFSFCNDGDPPWRTGSGWDMWGPDHSSLSEAVAGKKWVFLAGTVAESGYAMVAVDADGIKRMHYNAAHGTGLWKVCLATDDTYLYAAHDGPAWGQRINRKASDWEATYKLTVTRYDIATGRISDFPGHGHFAVVRKHEAGPGSATPDAPETTLGGLAYRDGKLYLADRQQNTLLVLDGSTCRQVGSIPLTAPGPVRAAGAGLVAVSGTRIVRIDPATGATQEVIPADAVSPAGIAVVPDGRIYVSDHATHTVRVFDSRGREQSPIGKPGGAYTGKWQAERMVNPRGIAISANGWLWVTEERRTPKRACAWDLATGKLVKQKFGPTNYGASGAGFDRADPSRWIGQGTQWRLDLDDKTAAPVSILGGHFAQRNYDFVRRDGRVFLIGFGGFTSISELLPDGTKRELAAVGSTHRFSYALRWNPPTAFVEAFNRAYPDRIGKHSDKGPGFLWVDKSGDGDMQPEEFSFSTAAQNFAGAYWGHDFADLTIRVPARVGGAMRLVTLRPDGYHSGGAPRYPDLNEACRRGGPIELARNEVETATDRLGNLICNSDPRMKCFSPDGKLRWHYPNRWTNVHGSHRAPLPENGVMQGALYFLGMAPFDEAADVFVVNSNHGRFFALTSDGIYLDEMFKDVRMGGARDAYLIGGECFGGFFARSEKDGVYYLQSGHTDYRIFRIDGIDRAVRSEGALTVTPKQLVAAERRQAQAVAATVEAKEAAVPRAQTIDVATGDRYFGKAWCAEWGGRRAPARAKLAYDAKNLYLHCDVRDASPWVNKGKDWQLLFKTGDSIDLQLAADPKANPRRTKPVPGDIRLLIASFDGDPLAVLYRHRLGGTKTKNPVTFSSPWRSEIVDEVRQLSDVRIHVARSRGRYTVTAAIPLAELGLTNPAGQTLRADLGVLYGDPEGVQTGLRSYWSNKSTGIVNDVPGEIMLHPSFWGALSFAAGASVETSKSRKPQISLVGILANSGESGDSLVRMGEERRRGGLGVVMDRHGYLWDRAGRGRLNRYAPDGRLIASFRISGRSGHRDQLSIVGDTLVLLLHERVYTLEVNAEPGAEPTRLNLHAIASMSSNAHQGRLAISQRLDKTKSRLAWLDPAAERVTPVVELSWNDVWGLDVAPDGIIYAASGRKMHKIRDGALVDGWRRTTPGERAQLIDGFWYGHTWHGTVKRFNTDLQPDPGVVLGGASGSFIGHLSGNYELANGRGLCRVGQDLYAIGGLSGVMHLMRWDGAKKRMELVRRIGSLRGVAGLGLDREGRIFAGSGCWLWDDAPDTPQRLGVNGRCASQCVMLPNDYVLTFGRRYGWPGHPAIVTGPLNKEVGLRDFGGEKGWDKLGLAPKHDYYGAVWYRSQRGGKGPGVLLILDDQNTAHAFRVNPANARNCYRGRLGTIELRTAAPVQRYRSLAMEDDDILMASADGAVIRFARDGSNWREIDRFAGSDSGFGGQIDISCDRGRLWIADTKRHRVLCLDAESRALLATFGQTDQAGTGLDQLDQPTAITARGDRCVVYDSGNQRLVRLMISAD